LLKTRSNMSGLLVLFKLVARGIKIQLFDSKILKDDTKESNSEIEANENHWIINGKVYDLTPFLDFHPGGRHILLMNRGRDCTELFFMYHLASPKNINNIISMLNKYYIRDAKKDEIATPFNWNGKNHEMYLDLKLRIKTHFDTKSIESKTREKASYNRMIWYFILFIGLITTHYYWFNGYWLSIPILSLLHWLFSSDLLHNGTHYQLVKNSKLNQLFSFVGGFYFVPNIEWEMQHVISHHSYTNVHDLDVDLNHFLDSFRTTKDQKYHPIYSKWRRVMPLYMLMTSIGQIDFWGGRVERTIHRLMVPFWINNNNNYNYAILLYIIQLSWIFAILPCMILYKFGISSFFKAFGFVLLTRVGHGVLYYIFSQVSHIQTDAFDHDDNLKSDSWIIHQIQSCVDYSIYSLFWNIASIGLNNQTIHHLCPSIHPCHYVELQPVLDQFCKDYNVKRRIFPNIYQTLISHFKHLALMNDYTKTH